MYVHVLSMFISYFVSHRLRTVYAFLLIQPHDEFSLLQAFNVVFQKAIERAEPSEEIKIRVENLIDCITYSVFIYTTRGLFEADKLTFTAQVAFQVCV